MREGAMSWRVIQERGSRRLVSWCGFVSALTVLGLIPGLDPRGSAL
jgi:hypothetical protein